MRIHLWIHVATILLVAACVPKPVLMKLPDNHPANPSAAESTLISPANPFDDRTYATNPAGIDIPEDPQTPRPMTMKPKSGRKGMLHPKTPEMPPYMEHGQ